MKTDAEILALIREAVRQPNQFTHEGAIVKTDFFNSADAVAIYRRAFRDGAEASSGSAMRGAFAERERDEARMAYTMLRTAVANALTDFEDGDEEALQQLRELLGTNQEAT